MEIVCVIIYLCLDNTYRIIERSHHQCFSESAICQKMRSQQSITVI
ncbi:hypothetical protein [Nostoc sp.]